MAHLASWPSTIFSTTSSGLPSSRAFSSKTRFSASRSSAGISSAETYVGRGRGDVQGDLVGEGLEVLVAGDEVGLALDFDHRPDLVVGVDVGGDDPLAGPPPFPLGGRGLPLDPQDLNRPIDVPLGLRQRRFAIHHRRPSPIPQRLHIRSGTLI